MGSLSHTVSGDIASFRTPSRIPIESLKFHFLPKQAAGTPTPENPIPIEGWTGLNGIRSGRNLLNPFTNPIWVGWDTFYTINSDGSVTISDSDWRAWGGNDISPFPLPKGTYTFSWYGADRIQITTSDESYNNATLYYHSTTGGHVSFTLSSDGGVKFKLFGDYPFTCTVQIEPGLVAHDYVPYSEKSPIEQIPITFPDGETIYGGYVDPVAGEIVAEFKVYTFNGEERIRDYPGSFTDGIRLVSEEFDDCTGTGLLTKCNKAPLETSVPSTITRLGIRIGGGIGRFYFFIPDSMFNGEATVEKFKEWLSENNMTVVAKLTTPIHIPIAPQDLQAFLDHNNFWSDANDITEVTYAVTESKDILATRKKAMDFDMGHRRKVGWNQLQVDGNFQDIDNWESSSGYNTLSKADGVMTCTVTSQPSQFYQTGFRTKNKVGFLQIPYNHKILVSAYLRCSVETRARIYGLVGTGGNTYIYQYNHGNVNIPANTWTRFFGFISDRPETPPSSTDDVIIKRFKPCVVGKSGDITTITVGSTFDCKNLMVFDLTQMFGLGNEPSTVAEFEHICEINGIDLTTYQPYDEGSDRWLIIP